MQLDSRTVDASPDPGPAGRQALSGLRKTIAALIWTAIALYGVGWLVLGGAIGETAAMGLTLRLLGVVLIGTSANVVRATIQRRAMFAAWLLDIAALCGVVLVLYLLLGR